MPRYRTVVGRFAVGFALVANLATPASARAQNFPAKLADSVFWKLVTDFSEPGGSFRSDNFVSNETTYQWVIPDLLRTTRPGGVYLGVGPDQNFTYLVALKPQIAFIFDIRRQNMLTHLMYKAIIEESSDRADFLSRLFARTRPKSVDSTATPEALFIAYSGTPPDSARFAQNLRAIKERLTKTHGFTLSDDDLATIGYVYEAFVTGGPGITYNFSQNGFSGYARGRMPTYADLQVATDSTSVHRSYLANETNFRTLKALETNNLVVPLVGDFGGPKAIRAVGTYLREHNATVTAFYLSNVEQYLFQDDGWIRFYKNAGTLPLDSSSTFIRSVFNGMGYNSYGSPMRAQQLLASMLDQVKLFNDGKITYYNDVIRTSR